MAVIRKGILGGISGKVANIVGGRWKTTDYIRSWVIPANPKSALQVIQRDKMKLCVNLARKILGSVINPFWDPFVTAQSGFNRFIQINIKLVADPVDFLDFLMCSGKLLKTTITGCEYTTGTGLVAINWNNTANGNQDAADKAIGLCYDEERDLMFIDTGGQVRSDGSVSIDVGTGEDETKMSGYLFLYNEVDSIVKMVSDSTSRLTSPV